MRRRPSTSHLGVAVGVVALLLALASIGQGGAATAAQEPATAQGGASAPAISGRVTDAEGHPIRDASVSLYQQGRRVPGAPAITDAGGRYTYAGLAAGRYRVCANIGFQTACYADVATLDQATDLTLGSRRLQDIDISMRTPGRLTGTVTLQGAPLANADVTLYFQSAYLASTYDFDYQVGDDSVTTNRKGVYTFPRVSPGVYAVRVQDSAGHGLITYSGGVGSLNQAEYVTVGSAQTTSEDVAVRAAGTISGTMRTADGTPATGLVSVYPVGVQNPVADVDTASDGTYSVGGLDAGRYVLRFYPDDAFLQIGWSGGASTRRAATVVRVRTGDDLTGVDSALQAAGELTGSLSDATSGAPVGFPLTSLQKSDGAGGWTIVARYEGYRGFGGGPEGYYDFRHLAPGTYRLSASELGYHKLYLPSGSTVDQGQDFTVSAGQQLTESATMRRATAIVGQITVEGSGGSGAGYTQIDAYGQAADGSWQLVDSFSADRGGAYRATGLSPGTYRLGFSYPTLVSEFYDDQPTLATATDVVVTRDHWTEADASLASR